jgi:hypothetical protein
VASKQSRAGVDSKVRKLNNVNLHKKAPRAAGIPHGLRVFLTLSLRQPEGKELSWERHLPPRWDPSYPPSDPLSPGWVGSRYRRQISSASMQRKFPGFQTFLRSEHTSGA